MTWLAEPHIKHKTSVIAGLKEFMTEGRYPNIDLAWVDLHFSEWVQQLLNAEKEPFPDGIVKESIYWIMDLEEYVGRISLRHELNDKLRAFGGHIGYEVRPSRRREGQGTRALALILGKARRLGLDRVMLTCDETNIGSRKIIQTNGGVHEDTHLVEGRDVPIMRWWIELR